MRNPLLLIVFTAFFLNCSEPIKGKVTKVVVYKSKRKMMLMTKEKVKYEFKIALGFNPKGHKVKEGDGKTPEGKYTLDWRNNKSLCYRSIHVSYPNKQDRLTAKKLGVSPGGNIMIHGILNGKGWIGKSHTLHDWTDGCIAVTNSEMDIIWNEIKYGTPIIIYP